MNTQEKNKDNQYNNIIKDLNSKDESKVLIAIKQLRKYGKPESIDALLNLYISTHNSTVKSEITSILYDLKDEQSVGRIISAIENEKYATIKPFIISILWQSSVDASSYLDVLITQAIEGDYEICLEVLTVIENLDTTFNADEISDINYDLIEAIENEETDKKFLLISLKDVIDNLTSDY
ncbi:MAG: hypothetical protein H6586_09640 [Flavobacteriales bacterium]|nr:hypothetical protein [Flavobacteriales bacterium]